MNFRVSSLLLIALLAGAGCVNRAAQDQAKVTSKLVTDTRKPVKVVDVIRKDLSEYIQITGQISTDSDSQIGSKVAGKLIAVYVKEGDRVTAGQVVAEIDTVNQRIQVNQTLSQINVARAQLSKAMSNARLSPARTAAAVNSARAQIRAAQAQLKKAIEGSRPEERAQTAASLRAAKSNMDTAKQNRDRQSNLYAEGAASKQQFEQAENAYQAALAQYEQALQTQAISNNATRTEDIDSARETVRQAEEALRTAQANQRLDIVLDDDVRAARGQVESAQQAYRLAQQTLTDAYVRAPFSGTVLGQPSQPGTVVAPGSPVVRLIGNSGLYFEGDLPSTSLNQIQIGAAVNITVDGVPGRTFVGRLDSISPAATNVGRVFRGRIKFPSFDSAIRSGMFANGKVKIRQANNVLAVPTGSIVSRAGKDVVYVIENNVAKEVPVTQGLTDGGFTEVTGALSQGQKIASDGVADLVDKAEVQLPGEKKEAPSGTH